MQMERSDAAGMTVLLLGLDPATDAAVTDAAKKQRVKAVGRAALLSEVPADTAFSCVFIGDAAVGVAWGPLEELVRRQFPGASLVAVSPRAVPGSWDDVLPPAPEGAGMVPHVLRLALRLADVQEQLSRWALRDPLTEAPTIP